MNLKDIMDSIRPTQHEQRQAQRIFDRAREFIERKYNRETILVGSVAKGTFLRGDKDLDIFVFFDKKTPRKKLEREGLLIGKETIGALGGKYKTAYAEHPYVSGVINSFKVEIVPCYKVEDPANIISAVDRTPFHLKFINENLKNSQKDDVRLLKKFLKTQKIYGADSKANGFSGYLCELLIIYYGGFIELLEHACKWKEGTELLFLKTEKKFDDPLLVIDPVDPKRNVASAVSQTSFSIFVDACRNFILKPNKDFFSGPTRGYTPTEGGKMVLIKFEDGIEEEIFFSQLRKAMEYITKKSLLSGFKLYRYGVCNNGVVLDFEIFHLPKIELYRGPKIDNYEHSMNFREKHAMVFVKGMRLYTLKKRKYTDAIALVNDIIKEGKGIGKNLKDLSTKIVVGKDAARLVCDEIVYF
ncbi:MAG: CCA tRNA nucleotidyltransferase [Candidatus Methanofastidiosia archaeon]